MAEQTDTRRTHDRRRQVRGGRRIEDRPDYDAILVSVSDEVAAAMEAQGISQRQLARMIGSTQQTVLNLLKAKGTTIQTLIAVSKALHIAIAVDIDNRITQPISARL